MYLQKAPNGVYQTRICIPKPLRKFGYPFDIKVSLFTKERSEAIARNFLVANYLRSAIGSIDPSHPPKFAHFKSVLDQNIDNIRHTFNAGSISYKHPQYRPFESGISSSPTLTPSLNESMIDDFPVLHRPPRSKETSFEASLVLFVESKHKQGITKLAIHQLEQRINHCMKFLARKGLGQNTVTSADLLDYVDHLISEKRSAKSNQGYFASVKQYFSWLKAKGFNSDNPAAGLNPKFKNKQHAYEQRERWTEAELIKLFRSPEFLGQADDFQWVTKLQLFHGFRTGEVCQIYVKDIMWSMGILCIKVTDISKDQHLKNRHAVRTIPLHPMLRESFLQFYESRKTRKCSPLFNYKPLGKDKDWTKTYRQQFGKLQTKIGMRAGARPTAYSLRHTFIDELKIKDIPEHSVAEVVGHTNKNMTYGRYGKKHRIDKLLEVVAAFEIDLEVTL
ncbi:tyrosine-type recombinase/integrase [Vibrio parahaemolyticus]